MPQPLKLRRIISFALILLIFVTAFTPALPAVERTRQAAAQETPERAVIAQVCFTSQAQLDFLAAGYDILEIDHSIGCAELLARSSRLDLLRQNGFTVTIDEAKSALVNQPLVPLDGQISGIPGYPCYRTVEESYSRLQELAMDYPSLTVLDDIGDSWEMYMPGGEPGYDIYALRITNEDFGNPLDKPTFFLMAEIHAREYVTAETALRFAEKLLADYGTDPDTTWLLDYFRIYVVVMTNPDGRKKAEEGQYWRKNTDNNDGCNDEFNWGTDLNRNAPFKWGGADNEPCGETYQGPLMASEQELKAIINFVLLLFPDQRGPGDNDPAPEDTTGTFVTLHSSGELMLWPWGWTGTDAPNHAQLQTLGRRMAYFNGYTPQQSNDLYPTTGTTDDWSYGVLGIASFTYEMGTEFFQSCASFESTVYPDNVPALLYAFKSARRPYMNPSGPDSLKLAVSDDSFTPGTPVTLSATADDTRFQGGEPTQNIASARYSIDNPAWISGTLTYEMTPVDGAFDEKKEDLQISLDTFGLAPGRHTVFVESTDTSGFTGVASAIFINIEVASYGFELSPTEQSASGDPGAAVVYSLSITNTGNAPDIYTLTLTSTWGADAPLQIGPLLSGESGSLPITITVPITATPGLSDTAHLTLTSLGDNSKTASAILTTSANPYYNLALSAGQEAQSGLGGSLLTYTLQLTNTGNLTDTFTIQVEGIWETSWSPEEILLPRGASTTINVWVQLPSSPIDGRRDVAGVSVVSTGDPSRSASRNLTSSAFWRTTFLPLTLRR